MKKAGVNIICQRILIFRIKAFLSMQKKSCQVQGLAYLTALFIINIIFIYLYHLFFLESSYLGSANKYNLPMHFLPITVSLVLVYLYKIMLLKFCCTILNIRYYSFQMLNITL